MAKRYWLFKSEPDSYSYDALVKDGVAEWDGVRNFQARNYLKNEIKEGDGILFYHSSTDPLAIVGTAVCVKEGHPDKTQWDPNNDHFDPKSTKEKPYWYVVDIKADVRFKQQVLVSAMKTNPDLANMVLFKRGRLSVQPVTDKEWSTIVKMGMG